jgi:hypothetical protein
LLILLLISPLPLLVILLLLLLCRFYGAPIRSGGDGGNNPEGATHMDVRRFLPRQEVASENPAGGVNP